MRSRILWLISTALLIQSCGGGKHDTVQPAPSKATLVLPAQNAVCVTGTVISSTQSSVQFSWNAAANATGYTLVVENLLTATSTTQSTNTTALTVNLDQDTPYSWYVISTSADGSTNSDTWKFYNSGPGVVTYPPYPAEITSPTNNQTVTATSGTINLTWTGSSVIAGTIANYDVYFGTSSTPPLLQSKITTSYLDNVSVVSDVTYYWRVITRDNAGNTSDSGVYVFNVQ